MARKPSETVQTSFRIKEGLRRQIEQSAIKRGVSFNAEISLRMKESFDHEGLLTLAQAVSDVRKDAEHVRSLIHNAELFDQLVRVTNLLLVTKCADAAIVDKAKVLLGVIAHEKGVGSTGDSDGT
jgi:hypothetical protein